jgi:hypothetical protein
MTKPSILKYSPCLAQDGGLVFQYAIEDALREHLDSYPLCRIKVEAETFDGLKVFSLPKVPSKDFDRVLEWLYELDVDRIVSFGIGPVLPQGNP